MKVECENINNNNQKDEAYDKSQTVDGLTKTGDFFYISLPINALKCYNQIIVRLITILDY